MKISCSYKVRLNWAILLRFENYHFSTPFPLNFKNCESGFCSIVNQTPTLFGTAGIQGVTEEASKL